MHTHLKISLLFILNISIIFGQENTIEEIYKLNGNVKSVRYDSYLAEKTSKGHEIIEKGWEETEALDKVIEFNKAGKIIKISFFDKDAKLKREHEYVYKDSNLIKSLTKYRKSFYVYDSLGRVVSAKIFDRAPEEIKSTNINELAKKEKILVKYEYDVNGNLLHRIANNLKYRYISTTSYFYNKKGLLQKEETFTKDYKEWYLYKYDTNGRIINKKWLNNEDGLMENEINQYSEDELMYSIWENYFEGELEGKITYEYKNGVEVEINEYDMEDQTQLTWKYDYEFDSQNNWIKKIVHTYKGEYFIVNREIEYFGDGGE